MSENDLTVTISGSTFSLLLYENARCSETNGDQIGFLLGEIQDYETNVCTDTERESKHCKRFINIRNITTYPAGKPFFGLDPLLGGINEEYLQSLLSGKEDQIIGWFHFKKYLELTITIREYCIHRDLKNYFSKINNLLEDTFLFFTLSNSVNKDHSTHKFKHVVLLIEDYEYKSVPLRINNLGVDYTQQEGIEYKPSPVGCLKNKDYFSKLCKSLLPKVNKNSSDLSTLQLIQQEANKFSTIVLKQLCDSDKENDELEKKIYQLKFKIFEKKLEKFMIKKKEEEEKLKAKKKEEEERSLELKKLQEKEKMKNLAEIKQKNEEEKQRALELKSQKEKERIEKLKKNEKEKEENTPIDSRESPTIFDSPKSKTEDDIENMETVDSDECDKKSETNDQSNVDSSFKNVDENISTNECTEKNNEINESLINAGSEKSDCESVSEIKKVDESD